MCYTTRHDLFSQMDGSSQIGCKGTTFSLNLTNISQKSCNFAPDFNQ